MMGGLGWEASWHCQIAFPLIIQGVRQSETSSSGLCSAPSSLTVNDRMLDKRHYITGERWENDRMLDKRHCITGERWEECQAMSWLASWVRWSVKAVLLPLLASHLSDHGIEEHLLRGIHPVLVPFIPLPFTPLGDAGDFTTSGERKGLTWTWLLTRWGHLCWRKVCHQVQ